MENLEKAPRKKTSVSDEILDAPTTTRKMETLYQNRIVTIKAIEKKNWSGFTRYPKCKDTLIAQQGRGGYFTGLSEAVQRKFEADLQLNENDLAPYSKYWLDYAIHIHDKTLTLDLSRPKDLLDYHVCMASPRVANSVTEMDNWPKAEYVLYDAEEDAKKENVEVQQRRRAFARFGKMTSSEMKDVLKLMGNKADGMTATMVENKIDQLIQEAPEKFNAIMDLPNFQTRVLVEDLLRINAIRKSGTHFLVGDDVIGHDLDATIIHLEDPKNQTLLISLRNKLEAYR
jgi:hypothetical protein